jgi:amylosucrase
MRRPDTDLSAETLSDLDSADALVDLLCERYADHPEADRFQERIRAQAPRLWTAFQSVYGDGARQRAWAVEAVDAAVEGFTDRRDSLRELDRQRAETDDWFQGSEQLGYMCYVDQFAGSLSGVREKIPYLAELGVTYLHLMPLLEPRDPPNDGGYAVEDYRSVDPRLGSIEELRALAADLHDAGIVLALDFVMNHTAREHEWAEAARAGEERFEAFYLTYEDRTLPDQYEETVPEVFPDFAPGNFTYVDAMDRWVWTSFYDFQWDLDYGNPDVFVQMFRELLFITNLGTDVLRLDAVPFLWKELGTNCRNADEAHAILRAYRALLRIAAPGVLFKSEAIVAPEKTVKYLGTGGHEGEECDLAYNAPLMAHLWHALASENTQLLNQTLTGLPEPPDAAAWINYVRCHDDIGWGLADEDVRTVGQDPVDTRRFCADYYAGDHPESDAEGYRFQVEETTGEARTSGTLSALTGLQNARVEGNEDDVDRALRKALLLHNAVFAVAGLPLLYSGSEIGQSNDFSYLRDSHKAEDNRWVHRPEMDWESARRRHEDGTVEQRLFDGIGRLAETRADLDVLHRRADERVIETRNDSVFVVERARDGDCLLAVSNFSGAPQAVPIEDLPDAWADGRYTDVLDDERLLFPDGRLLLGPYDYRWLQPTPDATPGERVTTTIEVDVETEWGEQLFVTGPHDALGDWDVEAAVPLSATDYPTWTGELALPTGVAVEFEWLKTRDGEPVAWSGHRYGTIAGSDTVWRLE